MVSRCRNSFAGFQLCQAASPSLEHRRDERALPLPPPCCLKFSHICRQVISSFIQPVKVCNFISFHAELNVITHTVACKLNACADNTLYLAAVSARLEERVASPWVCKQHLFETGMDSADVTYVGLKGTKCSERLASVGE